MKNSDKYKNAVDQIKVDNKIINKTREKLRENSKGEIFMNSTKKSFLALACCLVVIVGTMYVLTKVPGGKIIEGKQGEEVAVLPKVENLEQLKELLEKSDTNRNGSTKNSIFEGSKEMTDSVVKSAAAPEAQSQDREYSTTNTQVKGVDEADIVKTDGKYIYYVSNSKIVIVDAQNKNDLKIVSEIKYDNKNQENFYPQEIYIENNKLVVIGSKNIYTTNSNARAYRMATNYTVAICYDTTNKSDIKNIRNVELEGMYVSSRMIDDNVYIVSNKYINTYNILSDDIELRPFCKDTAVNQEAVPVDYNNMYYFPDMEASNYLLIAGFNVNNTEKADIQTYLGAGSLVYSSLDNMYIATVRYNYSGYSDGIMGMIAPERYEVNTEIYKFKLDNGKTEFKCMGTVPGSVLNQFSMDENNGNFRIATTDNVGISGNTANNLYILDKDLKITGTLEGLARGEKIYSVRFMGDRAYIVTFKQVDPLFVIDVSNPENPKVLGELKIPGFSKYLHPYSENLLIGFGQDAETFKDKYGERTLTTGMKMALFDVTDANNPKELFSVKIGDRGTYSELLNNHKALLFSKEKDIIAFPITITEAANTSNGISYGKTTFQGAVIYGLDLDKGFIEKGKISHAKTDGAKQYFTYDYNKQVERIIFIDNTLFTISKGLIKSIDMNDMKEIDSLEIKIEKSNYYSPYLID